MPVFCHVKKYANCEPAWKAKYNGGLVFAKGDKADAAKEAGADYVGEADLAQKIQQENWFDPK